MFTDPRRVIRGATITAVTVGALLAAAAPALADGTITDTPGLHWTCQGC